jgi:membrane-associated phospholipid phosphatase
MRALRLAFALCAAALAFRAAAQDGAPIAPSPPPPAEASMAPAVAFPFALGPAREAAWAAAGLALYGGGALLEPSKPAAALDRGGIPWFDGLYTTSHNASLGTAADALTIALGAAPVAEAIGLDIGHAAAMAAIYAETMGFAFAANSIVKDVVARNRPYAYSTPPPPDLGSADIQSSFPSRHATLAFASAVFAGYSFAEIHPDSPLVPWVWAAGLGAATAISALRVSSGDHFLSDVAAGAALGAVSGFLVPWTHLRKQAAPVEVAILPQGLLIGWRLD